MSRRLAVAVALLVFGLCLILGMEAGNSFTEILTRALKGLFGTLAVGLVIGTMAQKMLDENLKQLAKKAQIEEAKPSPKDR